MTEQNETQSAPKLDIHNTKEALKLGFSLIGAIKVSKENDGKLNAADLGNLIMVFPHIGPAVDDVDQIIPEMKDLDTEEAKELMEFASKELGGALSEEELINKIELSLQAVVAVFRAVKAW